MYQQNEIDSLYEEVSQIPHGQSAERLIKLFESMDDVSFIYVKHNANSGFVTYQKQHLDNRMTNHQQNVNDMFSNYLTEVEAWRKSLSLKDTNDILVSFAWSHDEQVRKLQQFPEFLACDTTFGVNKERRNLFVVSLVDGNNKQSNVMKVFMPSKKMIAYSWSICMALPFIIGPKYSKLISCIATDGEHALIQAVDIAKNSEHFNNPKHRLDYYHTFIQEWEKTTFGCTRYDIEVRDILNNIRDWMKTWYMNLESIDEYKQSRKLFNEYYNPKKEKIGDHFSTGIDIIIKNFEAKINKLANWEFKFCTDFGFKGSSIAEVGNVSIKKGIFQTKQTMGLDRAGYQLVSIA